MYCEVFGILPPDPADGLWEMRDRGLGPGMPPQALGSLEYAVVECMGWALPFLVLLSTLPHLSSVAFDTSLHFLFHVDLRLEPRSL